MLSLSFSKAVKRTAIPVTERLTRTYPGRLVFLGVNLAVALLLMEANMFDFLNTILGFYANCGMAWIVVVASDIVFNKYLLKLSPKQPEFRRGMLYAVNEQGEEFPPLKIVNRDFSRMAATGVRRCPDAKRR